MAPLFRIMNVATEFSYVGHPPGGTDQRTAISERTIAANQRSGLPGVTGMMHTCMVAMGKFLSKIYQKGFLIVVMFYAVGFKLRVFL